MKYLTVPFVRMIARFLFMVGCMVLGWGVDAKSWPLVLCFGFIFPFLYEWIVRIVSVQGLVPCTREEFEAQQKVFFRSQVEEVLKEREKNGPW